ncbi:hypothetical protein C8J57DRAFT_1672402 [Mycena rebaudengoi]|nr:hypothetical protein C8J57DRAFT_1672402 [Mycena rebaudengoi]
MRFLCASHHILPSTPLFAAPPPCHPFRFPLLASRALLLIPSHPPLVPPHPLLVTPWPYTRIIYDTQRILACLANPSTPSPGTLPQSQQEAQQKEPPARASAMGICIYRNLHRNTPDARCLVIGTLYVLHCARLQAAMFFQANPHILPRTYSSFFYTPDELLRQRPSRLETLPLGRHLQYATPRMKNPTPSRVPTGSRRLGNGGCAAMALEFKGPSHFLLISVVLVVSFFARPPHAFTAAFFLRSLVYVSTPPSLSNFAEVPVHLKLYRFCQLIFFLLLFAARTIFRRIAALISQWSSHHTEHEVPTSLHLDSIIGTGAVGGANFGIDWEVGETSPAAMLSNNNLAVFTYLLGLISKTTAQQTDLGIAGPLFPRRRRSI